MGEPRASRWKVVTISSDEDDDNAGHGLPTDPSEDEEPVKPQKRSTGKLKPVKKGKEVQQPTPAPSSTQPASSQKSPGKPKVSKAKSKLAVKEQPRRNGKPIYSFFNAATQRQQRSQPSASPEKPSTPQEIFETIHDDSEDDNGFGVQVSKSSRTALAVRKRKVHHSTSFENDASLPPPASQKFRKTSSGERVPSLSVFNEDKRPWNEQFAPKELSELAVHKRKVADVRQWLETTIGGRRQKVLVLKGAAGTGKTTTIRLLTKDMGIQVSEWRNPAGGELTSEGSASAAAQFDDFVARTGRSGGLRLVRSDGLEMQAVTAEPDVHESDRKQLLLVEEFPNTFSRNSNTLHSFRSAISQYLSSPAVPDGLHPTPFVMVISETLLSTNTALADSFTAHRLLGSELVNHPYLDMIEFNAIAPTILTKALETVVLKEARKSGRRRTPGAAVLKRLAESGDIRSAVSSLEFLCVRGDDGDIWSSKVQFGKQKKSKTEPPLTQAEAEALRLISNRESTLGIFHAVGKVVYNKRVDSRSIEHPPSWLPQHRRSKVPENNVDELVDELGTDVPTFIAALHENYALSCASSSTEETLDSLLSCINDISDADLLSVDRFSVGTRAFSGSATDSLRQDEMAFQVAARGLLFSLPYPVHRSLPPDGKRGDAHRMFYPSSLKLWKKREETEGVLDLIAAGLQAGSSMSGALLPSTAPNSIPKGVETWKQNTRLDSISTGCSASDTQSAPTNSAKAEMLLERLPYLSQIIGSKGLTSRLSSQLATVTRMHGSTLLNDDEDEDAEMAEDAEVPVEQWTTDKPDHDISIKGPKMKSKQSIKGTEKDGLRIPVESRIEKLVLEEDDIVDE